MQPLSIFELQQLHDKTYMTIMPSDCAGVIYAPLTVKQITELAFNSRPLRTFGRSTYVEAESFVLEAHTDICDSDTQVSHPVLPYRWPRVVHHLCRTMGIVQPSEARLRRAPVGPGDPSHRPKASHRSTA
jgi:hypothetical protein